VWRGVLLLTPPFLSLSVVVSPKVECSGYRLHFQLLRHHSLSLSLVSVAHPEERLFRGPLESKEEREAGVWAAAGSFLDSFRRSLTEVGY